MQTISYDATGQWQNGKLPPATVSMEMAPKASEVGVIVVALFTTALTTGAVTYLLSQLIGKFSGGLKPSKIKTSVGALKLEVTFDGKKAAGAVVALDQFETAVNNALSAARQDKSSGLSGETWTLSDAELVASY